MRFSVQVFFGVTKLFQSQDHNLRRMMYLFIKEVAETCDPDDVIIGERIQQYVYMHGCTCTGALKSSPISAVEIQ